MIRYGMRAAVSVAALMAPLSAALAQSPSDGSITAVQQAPAETGVADIVVTAQRKAERLEDVPIAIAALSAERIVTMGIVSAKDVQLLAPGLNFETSYGYAQPYIRGIGSQSPTPGIEASTAIYIDGIYQPHAAGALTDIFDMAGVQVLRGAQGTLYGRNASGGAILYGYAEPVIGEHSLKMTAEYGKRNHVLGSVIGNVPLSDTLALRISGQITQYDGYITNIIDGQDWGGRTSYNIRGKLKWEATPELTADLTVEEFHSDDFNATQTVRGPKAYCLACNLPIPGADLNPVAGFYDVAINSHQSSWDYDFFRASLKLSYNSDKIAVSSQSYYFKNRARVFSDQGNSSTFSFFDYDPDQGGAVYGQDINLITKFGGMFDVMVGGSYSHAKSFNHTIFNGLAFGGLTDLKTENFVPATSTAGFAELYVKPSERIKITLGGRYTHDVRKLKGIRSATALLAYDFGANPVFRQKTSSNIFTGRAVVDIDLDAFHLYGGWTSGYKAGGFSTVALRPTTIITPEKIDNFEGGVKYVSPDRRFRSNLAIFYYKYRNAQVTITDLSAGGQVLANAGSARGYGGEADFDWEAAEWLTLFGSAAYVDAKYLSYPNGSIVVVDPATNTLVNASTDLKGTRLPRAPKWTLIGGFTLKQQLSDAWEGQLSSNIRYTTNYDFYPAALGPLRFARQKAYALVNMSADIKTELQSGQALSIGLYANNVTSTKYFYQKNSQAVFGLSDIVAEPVSYGVRTSITF